MEILMYTVYFIGAIETQTTGLSNSTLVKKLNIISIVAIYSSGSQSIQI